MSDYIATVQFRYIPTNAYFKYGDGGMVLLFHEASEVWVPGASDPSWEYMTNEWLDETMNKSPEKWEILPDPEGFEEEEEEEIDMVQLHIEMYGMGWDDDDD